MNYRHSSGRSTAIKETFAELSSLFLDKPSLARSSRRRMLSFLVTGTFVLPSFLLYTGFLLLPALLGLAYTFTSWNGIGDVMTFIGLENLRSVFSDFRFFSALRHTLVITMSEAILLSILSLIIAALIDTWRRHRVARRTIVGLFVFPFFLGTVMVTGLWRYILDFRDGFVNMAFRGMGLKYLAIDWLGNPKVVLFTIVGVETWSSIGIYILFYLTALQAIPDSLIETAVLDGAGLFKRFTSVMAPHLIWALNVNLVIILSRGLSSFETVLLLTQGGPGFSSETISYYIYWSGFLGSRQGYGSTMSVILFCATSIISMLLVANLRKRSLGEEP